MAVPTEITEATERERRRCIGVVLGLYGVYRIAGKMEIAEVLDALATELEHPDEYPLDTL